MVTIGFVGATGLMGHGIAKNIQAAGYPLRFTTRSGTGRVADLLEAGAELVADHAELGRTCDMVFVCVTAASDVEQVSVGC
jgi:3-hydroxyisobutyrate dehydrogenase-like beta-hydroxyacid dehydrogenase